MTFTCNAEHLVEKQNEIITSLCLFEKIINLLRSCKYKIYTTVTFHVVNFKFTGRV